MALPSELVDEFAKVTHDTQENKETTLFYGTARFTNDGDFVKIDGSDLYTPATFATSAVTGDRVMGTIKNHKAIITANISNPSMTLGILRAISGIIVEGYLTTNAQRIRYDDQTKVGLTFSNGGIGAYGGQGKYWYITSVGEFRAESAYVKGTVSASSGYIGGESTGFKIDEYGIYSGATKTGTSSGFITLGNTDFQRAIGGTNRTLRFAIGSNFGVTATGVVYANDVNVRGNITATAGKVGDFNINGAIYSSSKSTFGSNAAGVYLGTDGIALGQDNKFKVTSAGVLTATGATISGAITATSLTLASGVKVPYTSVSGTPSLAIYIAKDGKVGSTPADGATGFLVSSAGLLTASNAVIYGTIYASAGKIGGWSLESTALHKETSDGNYRIRLQAPASPTTGNYAIRLDHYENSDWKNLFYVGYNGHLYASSATIKGAITATSLTLENGVTVPYGSISNPPNLSVYISKGGEIGTAAEGSTGFVVSSAGLLKASNAIIYGTIYASGGKIGGWNLESGSSGALHKTTSDGNYRIRLQAPASPTPTGNSAIRVDHLVSGEWTSLFTVRYDGYLYAKSANIEGTITANAGKIGSWNIGAATNEKAGSLWSGTFGSNGSIFLIPGGTTASKEIAGRPGTDWTLSCGSSFGVTTNGAVYANSGKIGPLNITSQAAYSNTMTAWNSGTGVRIGYGVMKDGGSNNYYFAARTSTAYGAIAPGELVVHDSSNGSKYLTWDTTMGLVVHNTSIDISGGSIYMDQRQYLYAASKTLIGSNGTNLWIGAASSTSKHHTGGTYISTGYTGSAGNSSIYVAVPNASNNNSSLYQVLHTGFYKQYTGVKTETLQMSNFTISANGTYNVDFTPTIPSGYSLIGCPLFWLENGTRAGNCTVDLITTINSGTGIRVRVRNVHASSTAEPVVKIKVLYARLAT